MKQPDADSGKLSMPDAATQREVMKFWRMAVELERQHQEHDKRCDGRRPTSGR